MRWITYIGISAYIMLVFLYSFSDHTESFWTGYYNITGAYIGCLGLGLNFKENKTANEKTFIFFAFVVRSFLFFATVIFYVYGESFLNVSLSFYIWLIVASFLSLLYKTKTYGNK